MSGAPSRKSTFEGTIGVASGWIVVFLAAIATWYLLTYTEPGATFRVVWYGLVAVALIRAGLRTWRFMRARAPR